MTRLLAPECGCVFDYYSGPRPERCDCDQQNRLCTPAELAPKERQPLRRVSLKRQAQIDAGERPAPARKPMKRSEPKRDWTLANAKRDEEEDLCRVTGEPGTELAHVMGRKYDEPISPGSRTLLVLPDRVVPLAPRIHTAYDLKEFDLLPYLTTAEQAQAVLDAGSIGLALKRISPVQEERVA